jgi:hypothetical protein
MIAPLSAANGIVKTQISSLYLTLIACITMWTADLTIDPLFSVVHPVILLF